MHFSFRSTLSILDSSPRIHDFFIIIIIIILAIITVLL